MLKNFGSVLVLLLMLTACTGALDPSASRQEYAGISEVTIESQDLEIIASVAAANNPDAAAIVKEIVEELSELPCAVLMKRIHIVNGKERQGVDSTFNGETCTFTYIADEEKAFEGQAIRAEAEKIMAQEYGKNWRNTLDNADSVFNGVLLQLLTGGSGG